MGVSGGCGNVVNPKGFPSFPWPERGGKGGGDFLFRPRRGRSLASPFPPSRPQALSCRSSFSFCYFFFYEVRL